MATRPSNLIVMRAIPASLVMAGLDPAIHLIRRVFDQRWIAGSSPVTQTVIARLERAPSIPEAVAIEPRRRGVLDAPLSRSMTTSCGAAACITATRPDTRAASQAK